MKTVQEFHDSMVNCQLIDLWQFVDVIPELELLSTAIQSPPFHCEGPVINHTNMAMKIVLQLMEAEKVENREDQVVLHIGTMLHDIGKKQTYAISPKHGRVTAHGHETAGIPLANEFLKKYFPEFPYIIRERILRLIEWHMKPRDMMNQGTTVQKMKMLSLAVNTKLLYLLSQADTLGRTADEFKLGMFALELFKQNCEDLGIYNKPYRVPLATHLNNASYSLARWNILMNDAPESEETYEEAQNLMIQPPKPNFQLMLMVGAPGAGKTTVRDQLVRQYPALKVICMDEKRKELCGDPNDQSKNAQVFGWQEKELRKAMKARENTLIDATNPTRKMRKHLWQIGRENGALCSAIYFDLSLDTLLARNAGREKRVPDEVVIKFYNALQSVAPWEADLIRIVEDNGEL